MVEEAIMTVARRYMAALTSLGIHARQVVLFGSFATGSDDEFSDIDLIVIAPEFDGPREIAIVEKLWQATASADIRIEPIPCGEKEWQADGGRPILEIARREGIVIAA
jgi:predicted nucleotidyltransferase